MKTFKPGDIIRAEDVNANFSELRNSTERHKSALKTTEWAPLTLSRGWSEVNGHTPRIRWFNGIVQMEGAVLRGSGGSVNDIAKVPSDFLPTKAQFIGATTMVKSGTATRAHGELVLGSTGSLTLGDYSSLDGGVNWIVPLSTLFIPA